MSSDSVFRNLPIGVGSKSNISARGTSLPVPTSLNIVLKSSSGGL